MPSPDILPAAMTHKHLLRGFPLLASQRMPEVICTREKPPAAFGSVSTQGAAQGLAIRGFAVLFQSGPAEYSAGESSGFFLNQGVVSGLVSSGWHLDPCGPPLLDSLSTFSDSDHADGTRIFCAPQNRKNRLVADRAIVSFAAQVGRSTDALDTFCFDHMSRIVL